MLSEETFEYWFSTEKLKDLFAEKIRYRCSPGLDRVGVSSFIENLDGNVEIISRKVQNGTYNFTKYNELLISKGRKKEPRCVSRPTIRDKLALCALHGYLQVQYAGIVDSQLIHSKIDDVIRNMPRYSHCVKVDIIGFYSSINHEILFLELSERIPKFVIDLIKKAISTPTVSRDFNAKLHDLEPLSCGVPEGLSISNLLANIYLNKLDAQFSAFKHRYYCRYVDDIIILINEDEIELARNEIRESISHLKLQIHDFEEKGKSCVVCCENGFSYLGYHYANDLISVKPSTIDRFEHSIERIFSDFRRNAKSNKKDPSNNIDVFAWKLNLKIAGCIFNNRKYGWMFFYSQITDLSLLTHLDWLVEKLYHRFGIEKSDHELKSFFKTYHEIKFNLSRSAYFYNADKVTQQDKEVLIRDIFHLEVPATEKEINDIYKNIISFNIKELEKDVQFFS